MVRDLFSEPHKDTARLSDSQTIIVQFHCHKCLLYTSIFLRRKLTRQMVSLDATLLHQQYDPFLRLSFRCLK